MPYITPEDRPLFNRVLSGFQPAAEEFTLGGLNYLITKLILMYWKNHHSYAAIAGITGVLENAKQEFYRRTASPYEDLKKSQNGDVYTEV